MSSTITRRSRRPPPRRSIAAMAAAATVLLSMSPVSVVGAAGYVRLCPLRHQPVLQLVRDGETGQYVLFDGGGAGGGVGNGDGGGSGNSTADETGGGDGDNMEHIDGGRRARDRGSTVNSDGGTGTPQVVVEGRECPCATRYYCLLGDGDTCGIPRNGEAGGAVGCFELNSRTVFIRNAWPVVVLWYGALFIFLVATENGRNARHYCMSKMCAGRNRLLAERIVRNEVQLRDRMRTAALAHQRRLFLTAVNGDRQLQRRGGANGGEGQRDVWANEDDGRDEDAPPPALVLKTKQYRREEDAVYGLHRRGTVGGGGDDGDGAESPPPPPLSSPPKTPTRDNLSDPDDGCGGPPMVAPDTPDTVPNHASPSFDDDDLDDFDDDEVHTTCTICLAHVEDGDRVGVLKCRHVFHSDCLKDWLRRRNVCPLCQSPDVASPASRGRGRGGGARRGRASAAPEGREEGETATATANDADIGGDGNDGGDGDVAGGAVEAVADANGSVAIRVSDGDDDTARPPSGTGSGPRSRTLVRVRRLGVGSPADGRRGTTTTASTSTTTEARRSTNRMRAWWPRRNGAGASSSSAARESGNIGSGAAGDDGADAVAMASNGAGQQPSRTEEGRSED